MGVEELNLDAIDINMRRLSDHINYSKETLLLFINTDCDYCIDEISYINSNIRRFRNRYNLILISFENKNTLKVFANKNNLHSFFVISDENFQLIKRYNVSGFPTLFLFSKNGKIIIAHNGIAISILKKLIS